MGPERSTESLNKDKKLNTMKKVALLLSICIFGCANIYAQTYTYRYLYTVAKQTEEKSKTFGVNYKKYVTFTNNKSFCYFSDQNGIKSSDMISRGEGYNEYHYQSGTNGICSYKSTETFYTIYFGKKVPIGEPSVCYMNFSTDYERLNHIIGEWVHVFERSDNKQTEAPSQLW